MALRVTKTTDKMMFSPVAGLGKEIHFGKWGEKIHSGRVFQMGKSW